MLLCGQFLSIVVVVLAAKGHTHNELYTFNVLRFKVNLLTRLLSKEAFIGIFLCAQINNFFSWGQSTRTNTI